MTVDLEMALAQIAQKAKLANEAATSFRGEIYGPSGTGKSTLAAMIMRNLVKPEDGIILDIDTSEGYVSWGNFPGLSDGIVVLPFTTLEDLNTMAEGIKQKVGQFANVRGIIFDEGSKMAEQDAIRVNRARQAGGYGDKMKATANFVADGPDYQIALERWREMLFKMFDNRDLHIIVCAHQADKKDRNGNVIGVSPQFSPKVNAATKEYMHLVANLTRTVTTDPANPGVPVFTHKVQVHPTLMVDAKCRMDIETTTIDAMELPLRIYHWMNKGGELQRADDSARPEIPNQETLSSGTTGELLDPNLEPSIESMEPATLDLSTDFGLEKL